MVSLRDRALIEARAAGIDVEKLLKATGGRCSGSDIVGPAFAISLFLLLYYIFVAFLVVYFATVFGYSEAKANDLANWYWIANAIALLAAGVLSDKLRVRKPLMIVGAVVSLIGVGPVRLGRDQAGTSYDTFAFYFILMAAGSGSPTWPGWRRSPRRSRSTTRPRPRPAWRSGAGSSGSSSRSSFAILPVVVPATSTLVDQGPRVQQIVATYPAQVKVLQTVDPATLGGAEHATRTTRRRRHRRSRSCPACRSRRSRRPRRSARPYQRS